MKGGCKVRVGEKVALPEGPPRRKRYCLSYKSRISGVRQSGIINTVTPLEASQRRLTIVCRDLKEVN